MSHDNLIETPKVTKRPWGLLTDSVPELGLDDKRWFAGVVTQPINGSLTRLKPEFCIGDDDDPYNAAIVGTTDRFTSFQIVGTETCSTLAVSYEWLQGRLVNRYDAYVSAYLAAEMEVGGHAPPVVLPNNTTTPNPTLSNSATGISGTPATPAETLAAIEGGLAYYIHSSVGVIHMSVGVFSLIPPGMVERGSDGIWRTRTGHVVVADAGFFGVEPGDTSPTTGVSWIYGTGPVGYQLAPIDGIDKPSENFDKTRNNYTGRVMAQGIYTFDTNTVLAAPVDMPANFGG